MSVNMDLVIIVIVQKHRKGKKVISQVEIIKEQWWEGSKNGNCAKLPGSYWL